MLVIPIDTDGFRVDSPERPFTGDLFTSITLLSSAQTHLSGGYTSELDLIPLWTP